MIEIVSSNDAAGHLAQLREWLLGEWEQIDPSEDRSNGISIPAPLLALEDSRLIGGLSFAGFRKPGSDEPALWIDAVFVTVDYRRKGVASSLIRSAEVAAGDLGRKEMYALTEVPSLYQKLNWRLVEHHRDGTVVGITLLR